MPFCADFVLIQSLTNNFFSQTFLSGILDFCSVVNKFPISTLRNHKIFQTYRKIQKNNTVSVHVSITKVSKLDLDKFFLRKSDIDIF